MTRDASNEMDAVEAFIKQGEAQMHNLSLLVNSTWGEKS